MMFYKSTFFSCNMFRQDVLFVMNPYAYIMQDIIWGVQQGIIERLSSNFIYRKHQKTKVAISGGANYSCGRFE